MTGRARRHHRSAITARPRHSPPPPSRAPGVPTRIHGCHHSGGTPPILPSNSAIWPRGCRTFAAGRLWTPTAKAICTSPTGSARGDAGNQRCAQPRGTAVNCKIHESQLRPTAHGIDPLGQQVREEHRKIDHAPATVLRRPEEPAGVYILVHRPELRIDLMDTPADAEPCRLQAKTPERIAHTSPHRIPVNAATITMSASCAGSRSPTARTVRRSTATPTRTGCANRRHRAAHPDLPATRLYLRRHRRAAARERPQLRSARTGPRRHPRRRRRPHSARTRGSATGDRSAARRRHHVL